MLHWRCVVVLITFFSICLPSLPVNATHDAPGQIFSILGFSKDGKEVLVKETYGGGSDDCSYEILRVYGAAKGQLIRSAGVDCEQIYETEQEKDKIDKEGAKLKGALLKRFGLQPGVKLKTLSGIKLAGNDFAILMDERVISQTPPPKNEGGDEDPFSQEAGNMKRIVLRTIWLERKGSKKIPIWWKKETETALSASLDECSGHPWLDKSLRAGSLSHDGATLALVLNSDTPQEKCNETTEPLIVSLAIAARQQNTLGFRQYKKKKYKKASHHFEFSHSIYPRYETAIYNRACVAGLQKDARTAMVWLKKLKALGTERAKKSLKKALKDKDFDPVRGDPDFNQLLK